MELALCVIDTAKQKLHFSGANRPLYRIRENELEEYKGNSMPIGIYEDEKLSFTKQEIPYKDCDLIYLFSDGYIDQHGGIQSKTFKSENFKKLLLKIHHLPMNEQKEHLIKEYEDWKGENEQTDDILIIGIKL